MRFSKRSFNTALFLAGILAWAPATPARAQIFTNAVGLQLESFSSKIKDNMEATLDKVHQYGFRYVELVGDYNLAPAAVKAELAAHDLTAVSAHFPYAKFHDDPEGVAREAVALGLVQVGCPALPQHEDLNEAGCREAIATFNRAGEILARRGIKFFYHPHGYEFKPHAGSTYFEMLMSGTKPEYVSYQMDIFWIARAGQNPVALLKKYPDRWISMHLKDMETGTATGVFTGHADRESFVPLGHGQLNLIDILHTAQQLGIKYYFIEDESANPEAGIPLSVLYLKGLK